MASLILLFTCSFLLLISLLSSNAAPSEIKASTYIIHTDNSGRPSHFPTQQQWYSSMVRSVIANSSSVLTAQNRIFYTYDTVLHGFAAKLSAQEAKIMASVHGVIGVYPNRMKKLHTTRTPAFLGLSEVSGLWPETNFGDGVIIGLVDSGIWPESASFKDDGFRPVGPEWRGKCENGTKFNASYCNNKLIGARYFPHGMEAEIGPINEDDGEYRSPRDGNGHGTHTASTAAGAAVQNASFFGFANGTARGIAPNARIAEYKACWYGGCTNPDILAAMEAAIKDGVHVLSISIGAAEPIPYYEDPIAKGAFSAVQNGIFVACSAGNEGLVSVKNSAPWITTVAAGTLDRSFPIQIRLGNGELYIGQSIYNQKIADNRLFPLVYPNSSGDITPDIVMGKIVVGDGAHAGTATLVQDAGGAGLIVVNDEWGGEAVIPAPFTLPYATVGYKEGLEIKAYVRNATNPSASFSFDCETSVGKTRAPMVAYFSSTGPDVFVPQLLKPDILAPGFDILAAWVDDKPPAGSNSDDRRTKFSFLSGTSMSCPHVAGMAALLRSAHPTWSPAAIRSALMTTSIGLDNEYGSIVVNDYFKEATPLAYGAGHANPQHALSPGLVYDASAEDYINFLCSLNYSYGHIRNIVNQPFDCPAFYLEPGELNYPSFSVIFNATTTVHVFDRTVTHVEEKPENYSVRVVNPTPEYVEITVKPQTLLFKQLYEEQRYSVEFKSNLSAWHLTADLMEFAHVIWESDYHAVRSPVVLSWKAF